MTMCQRCHSFPAAVKLYFWWITDSQAKPRAELLCGSCLSHRMFNDRNVDELHKVEFANTEHLSVHKDMIFPPKSTKNNPFQEKNR